MRTTDQNEETTTTEAAAAQPASSGVPTAQLASSGVPATSAAPEPHPTDGEAIAALAHEGAADLKRVAHAPRAERIHRMAHWFRTLDPSQVVRHLLFAVAAGVVGAAASITLCLLVDWANGQSLHHDWLLFALPFLGVASILLYRVLKLPVELGTHDVVRRFRRDEPVSGKLAPGILLGTFMTVLGGGSVGKEAAALQMGASLGQVTAKPFKLGPLHKNTERNVTGFAAATGMASCFSALFFAPLGSTMFVLELSHFDKTVVHRLPAILIGTFTGFFIASAVGIGDIIPKVALPDFSWPLVLQCLVVGLACGIGGTVFSKGIDSLHTGLGRYVKRPEIAVFVGGLLFAGLVLAFGWQTFMGTGSNLLGDAMGGHAAWWDFAVKLLLTVLALGFGFKGGEIMPMFTIGALLGCACALLTPDVPPTFSAALGLASFFSAASRCPLAALLIGCETFGWAFTPYLAVAVFMAYFCSSSVGYYGQGMWRGLRRSGGYIERVAKRDIDRAL